MNKFRLVVLIVALFLFVPNSLAQSNKPENDYLYSEAYFDYLIECASLDRQEEIENKKLEEKELQKAMKKEAKNKKNEEKQIEISLADNVVYVNEDNEEEITPFKLRIQNTASAKKYSETFKKEDSKIIIPVGNKFSFIHDTSKSRNKYSSTDYKILAGAEIQPFKFLNIAGGVETNYRDIDQNPASRKLYITPKLKITDKINLIFPNKYNISSGATDHDIGLNISPFKSKSFDFGVYSGLTKNSSGKTTQSVNFSTNIYLF